ncbi:sensor histidine kinase [Undibacterium sp.]|uniref:sensor histidine kinase n=1 Tax=Undibacterium sp. TaxID=1914977 RepID=UPI003750E6C8
MPILFFPRDPLFWLFHGISVLAITIVTLLVFYFWGDFSASNIIASVIWCLPYSAVVIGFRYLYKLRAWHQLPMTKLVPLVIVYGTLTGLLVAASVSMLTVLFFWSALSAKYPELRPVGLSVGMLIGSTLQAQLFICIWIFIYTSVTSARRIKDAELHNLRLQNTLKEAQLSSLSNQLNPHFLFNALNNIRFMMHENTQHADEMVVALSDILRYSLASSTRDKVSLQEELDIIERYLAIMKIQMEERLQIQMNIDPQFHSYLLPPMILQMLIENAIKHGIDQIAQGGMLSMTVTDQADQLLFEIRNDLASNKDGLGKDLAKQGHVATLGIGLENIRKRLDLLYGTKAQMHAFSQELTPMNTQFVVQLQLPKESHL